MIDREALAAWVAAVDAAAMVTPWDPTESRVARDTVLRVDIGHRLDGLRIDVWMFPRHFPQVECARVRTANDRAILRAVLDYLDEAEGV